MPYIFVDLKTYLRSTMTAQRVNVVNVLHIHKDRTDAIDLKHAALREFVAADDTCKPRHCLERCTSRLLSK